MTASSSGRSSYDVVVVGGGPAGSVAAGALARAGRHVVLLEEHAAIGEPVHCTGLVGVEAFEEFALPETLVLGRAGAARFWGATGDSVRVESDRVQAAVIDRAALDRTLADRAGEAGVEVRRGWRAEHVAIDSVGVRVTGRTPEAVVEARLCVLACGASYRFHRTLGLGTPDVFLQSAQCETPFPDVPDIEVRFGREVAPAGFAWLVPFHRGEASFARIGLMSETRSRERFERFVEALCARLGTCRADLPPPRLKMLPLGPIPRTYGDRVVAVGDAAGLVKPTTGGGIYYGMLSGSLAAGVLDEALARNRTDAAFLRRYEQRWRRRLGQEIRVGLAFRRIAARLSDDTIDSLIELARVNGIVPLLKRTASFNWHRKAAIALLGHPSFRKIVLKSWTHGDGPI